ncbi:hypothetical protein [Ephemeroptericola cinctiostellae]|nr:hypothetical protein [Ephemeroptericola cinctiostellae]
MTVATQTGWSRESLLDMPVSELMDHYDDLFELGLLERKSSS